MEHDIRRHLVEQVGSIYKLCNMAALRATELNSGMKKLVDAEPDEKITSIAIKEIAEGKVRLKVKK
ncbi:MAG: DNA-directed RNA polymerase subunit omega [Candidatus Omnitrophica bacterium]|nr:DNA-directed RNA polymerase subunit omega [Candidatus Omnitrophota bacterium]